MQLVFQWGSTIKSPWVSQVGILPPTGLVPQRWSTDSYLTRPLVSSSGAVIVTVLWPVPFSKCAPSYDKATWTSHTYEAICYSPSRTSTKSYMHRGEDSTLNKVKLSWMDELVARLRMTQMHCRLGSLLVWACPNPGDIMVPEVLWPPSNVPPHTVRRKQRLCFSRYTKLTFYSFHKAYLQVLQLERFHHSDYKYIYNQNKSVNYSLSYDLTLDI